MNVKNNDNHDDLKVAKTEGWMEHIKKKYGMADSDTPNKRSDIPNDGFLVSDTDKRVHYKMASEYWKDNPRSASWADKLGSNPYGDRLYAKKF